MEWLPICAAVIAGAMLLQSSVPTILPAEAPKHAGNTVTITGMVVEQAGNWLTIAAEGTSIQAWSKEPPAAGQIIAATGRLESEPWTLFIEHWKNTPSQFQPLTLAAFSENPNKYLLKNIELSGDAKNDQLSQGQQAIKLSETLEGKVKVKGVIQYQPDCLCHQLVINSWTSS